MDNDRKEIFETKMDRVLRELIIIRFLLISITVVFLLSQIFPSTTELLLEIFRSILSPAILGVFLVIIVSAYLASKRGNKIKAEQADAGNRAKPGA